MRNKSKPAVRSSSIGDMLAMALEHYQAGRPEDTRQVCADVLALDPCNADAFHMQGMAAKSLRNYEQAESCLLQAIEYVGDAPGKFLLYTNLGNILVEQGRLDDAFKSFHTAIALNPAQVDAYSSLGTALRIAGQWAEAEKTLRKAHEMAPERADVLNNLAAVLQQQGLINEAAEQYRIVLKLDPKLAVAHYNLACIYAEAGKLSDAVDHHEKALAIQPDYVDAMTLRLRLAQMMCDWPAVSAYGTRLKQLADRKGHAIFPFALLGLPASAAELQECARRWVRAQYKSFVRQGNAYGASFAQADKERIRVGYLSSDYHNHATAYLMAEVFELHDRKRFEIIAYSAGPDDGKPMRQRLVRGFDRFVDIQGMSHADAAKLINDDGIDILVDLKGYTKDTRSAILAFRPAPIQVNYLGYPGTMGADFVDYILADEFILPPDQAVYYDEQPAWLPDTYQANDRQRVIAARPSRDECRLPSDAIVFCCFNHTYKISEAMFAVWCKLLQAVPDSVLWLLKSNDWAEQNLRQAAVACGIDAARIVFAPEKPLEQHLARLQNADLFLDTLPYNAHTTASDALWAGVPVITCAEQTFASRVAGSLLNAAGLGELVTSTLDDYFALARDLATDRPRLFTLKKKLAETKHAAALFDTPRFTRNLEQLYEQMWQRHIAHQPPAPLRVNRADIQASPITGESMSTTSGAFAASTAKAQVADSIPLRTPFPCCPLCGGKKVVTAGSFNCTNYPIWKPPLPASLSWVKCDACKHVFTDSYYTEAGLKVLFSQSHPIQVASNNGEQVRYTWAPIVERVINALPKRDGLFDGALSWLDVGCGNGGLVFTAAEFGFKATGLDMREDAVQAIRKMGYSAIQGDISNAQAEKPINVISMADVLEHMAYPLETLKHVHKLLDNQGALFISCPNMETISWKQMDLAAANGYWIELEHYHNFSRESLMRILRQCGFTPVSYTISPRYKAGMEIIAVKNTAASA